MKKLVLIPLFAMLIIMGACNRNKNTSPADSTDSVAAAVADTAYYGVGGTGTSMHSLMLISDVGDTLVFAVIPSGEDLDDEPDLVMPTDEATTILGGMPNVGDRVAVTAIGQRDDLTATSIVNLTSLQGKWHSIDRTFEICEGGVINQSSQSEKQQWTEWKMSNGRLIMGTDTFSIDLLSPDSLLLENTKGIYAFTR